MPDKELTFLHSLADKPTRQLAKGETLFRMGDAAHAMYVLVRGQLRLVRYSAEGQTTTIHRVRPGETFAEASVFSENYHCDAVADSKAEVLSVSKKRIRLALAEDAQFALKFSSYLAHQVQAVRAKFQISNLRKAEDRVIAYFALLADEAGMIELDGSIKTAASEIGLTHEAFYRCLPVLEGKGIISRQGKHAFVLHRADG